MNIVIDIVMKAIFTLGIFSFGVLLWCFCGLMWKFIKDFYFNHIHKDAYKVTFALRRSDVRNNDYNEKYVNVSRPYEKCVLAKDKYDAVAKTMRDIYELHIVILDVQMISSL